MSDRLRTIFCWAAPPLLMLALYWRAFGAWFQKDDFAWLALRHVARTDGILSALFHPYAQGTIRTLSERVTFLSFGLHPLLFRLLAFATCAGALILLASIAFKLTGSRLAGFSAAAIWVMNISLPIALGWASGYNYIAWPFALLLMFWMLLRYVETGEVRFFLWQCVVFALGFFVLETNVVYPAIASAFAILSPDARRRGLLKRVAPLFLVSILYTAIHFYVAPLASSGPYQLHFDSKIFQTLTMYWGSALGPAQGRIIGVVSTLIRSLSVWILTAGLLLALIVNFRRAVAEERVSPLFYPAWFLIALAPLVPLRDHFTIEYLCAPALGIALWGGLAIAWAFHCKTLGKIIAAVLAAIYAGFGLQIGHTRLRSFADSSLRVQAFVESVVEVARAHPGKAIFLEGVNSELFHDPVYNRAFFLYGLQDVHLVPENRATLPPDRYHPEIAEFFAPTATVQKSLRKAIAIVLDVSQGSARDATAEYRREHNAEEWSPRIDFTSVILDDQVGEGWYTNDGGFRWMGKRATVTLAGPREEGERVYVTGDGPEAALKSGPLTLQFSIDGAQLGSARITKRGPFAFDFAIPQKFIGAAKIEVAVEVDRTFTLPPDPRVFGLVFTSFEVR